MPPWCQRNIINWIRLNGPTWSIRVLDSVPDSPNNALKWVDPETLPETFVKGTMDGPYTGPHSADFLRGACLVRYDGVWMDVGIILIRQLDGICWRQLEDPNSPFEVSVPNMHNLFIELWKGRTNHGGISENPLMTVCMETSFDNSKASNYHWEFKVEPITVMEYIGQVLAWRRVCMLEEPNGGFNGAEYYENKVLLFDSLTEDWGAEATIGFNGQDLFNVLETRLDADPESKEYQLAYKTIWRLLTRSSMQKITHGKNLTKGVALGVLLDMKENEGKDKATGTFAELLRYGSVHFEQNREGIDYVKAEKPEKILKKGLLEP